MIYYSTMKISNITNASINNALLDIHYYLKTTIPYSITDIYILEINRNTFTQNQSQFLNSFEWIVHSKSTQNDLLPIYKNNIHIIFHCWFIITQDQ